MQPIKACETVDYMNGVRSTFKHYEQLCVNFHTVTALRMVKIARERTQSQLSEAQKRDNHAFLAGSDYAISILEREA